MSLSKPKSQTVLRDQKTEEIVKAYLAGDNSKFTELRVIIQPIIKYIVQAKSSRVSREDRQDLIQECWLKVIKNLSKWNPERGTLKNFLFACFSNRMICIFRAKHNSVWNLQQQHDLDHIPAEEQAADIDLNIEIETRFTEPAEIYILQNVGTAMYLRTYDTHRARMHREFYKMTGFPRERVSFLMDYAVCQVRKFCLEHEWKTEIQNAH